MACALCLEENQLCESHIYPEFLYSNLYDESNHSFKVLSTDPKMFPKYQRKGVYEKLLCLHCEQHISKFENYAANVLFGGTELSIEKQHGRIIVGNIQYDKFKLFQMSILWRAGTSSRSEFNNVKLGSHREILRRMILSGDPGEPYMYGCSMSFLPAHVKMMERLLYPLNPIKQKIMGCRVYRGVLGGLFWIYFVSSHNSHFPNKEVFISKEGVVTILEAPLVAEQYLINEFDEFARAQTSKV